MKAIIEEASPETAQKMQSLALAEGALPIHLLRALYTKSSDNRLLMHAQLSKVNLLQISKEQFCSIRLDPLDLFGCLSEVTKTESNYNGQLA